MSTVSGVRGDLLRWAREQQHFTFRYVEAHGGPSRSYLSEVERGKKREVSSTVLDRWVRVLNVTEAFARGHLEQYRYGTDSVVGLAADVGALIKSGGAVQRDWTVLTEQERVREVLRLIAYESRELPMVVLAWVLNFDVRTLDALLAGEHLVMSPHLHAAVALTLMPVTFFTHGTATGYETYRPVFQRALELGISPQQLLSLIESALPMERTRLRRAGQPIA